MTNIPFYRTLRKAVCVMTFEEVLELDGRLIYTNKGISMMPFLRADKDVMIIEPCTASKIKKYDAVLFVRRNNKKAYVLHRVLRVNPDGTFWIVGDNCYSGETVRSEQILGKLTSVLRDGKRVEMTDYMYLMYVHIWCDFYPVRFLILRIKHFTLSCLRFIKRRLINE